MNISTSSSKLHCSLPSVRNQILCFVIDFLKRQWGAQFLISAVGKKEKKRKKSIREVTVFVPSLCIPVQSDLQKTLRGLIPKDLVDRISSLRNQIVLVAEDTGGSAISELQKALEDYLSLLLELVEFKWKDLDNGRQEICVANSWFELLFVLHTMAMLTLTEANNKLIPKDNSLSERLVSADCMRDAVDLLLKAAGYLDFCVNNVLPRLPPDTKNMLPTDLHESVLEAISNQALAQGTELQLGLAVQSQNATLPVKRRLACELLTYFGQAHCALSEGNNNGKAGMKHMLFLKCKYLEAKAAAYYYHGLILDKGTEPSCHISALVPPPWGAMKHLHKKIPETASKKSQMYGYPLDQEKGLQILPDLPEFQLSLKPDDYELPAPDSAWNSGSWEIPGQPLKGHLIDGEEEIET
ncbi:Endosomal targeting BRO1-like domain-containing protein [Forsythia ovata]|uniref:Endosomal targeting BRO1-like domain-containing protein n=1 Tax=Forsythia ovata TaxID=205694 RepID=A0ABD1UXL7_9LAMI